MERDRQELLIRLLRNWFQCSLFSPRTRTIRTRFNADVIQTTTSDYISPCFLKSRFVPLPHKVAQSCDWTKINNKRENAIETISLANLRYFSVNS